MNMESRTMVQGSWCYEECKRRFYIYRSSKIYLDLGKGSFQMTLEDNMKTAEIFENIRVRRGDTWRTYSRNWIETEKASTSNSEKLK